MTDRKMKTLEDSFQLNSGVVSNSELIQTFHRTFHPIFIFPEILDREILYRFGKTIDLVTFNLRLNVAPSIGGVCQVDIPSFSKSAISEAQKYRLVYSYGIDGNYLVVKDIEGEGTYLIASNNNPRFRIDIKNKNKHNWIASQLIIRGCEGEGEFRYLPNLDENPQIVTLETSVPLKAEGERGKLTKRLFVDFHNEIKEQYQSKGATHINKTK